MKEIETYDVKEIEEKRFQGTKKITKRMVDKLIKHQYKKKINKIKSPGDLQQLIEDL